MKVRAMADARAVPAPIPELAPLAFEQVIMAGGDDDVSAGDLFDWVAPLLAGIPGGRWMSCEIDVSAGGDIRASYRNGRSARMMSVRIEASAPAARELLELVPQADSLTVILLSDYSSQAVTLLDSIARWLSIHDTDDGSLAPVLRLMGGFHAILSKA